MEILKKLGRIYNKFEEYTLVYSLVLCTILVLVQVIARYVFNHSLSWSEELCRFIFIWSIWLGTSIAAKDNSHLRIEILYNKTKGWGRISLSFLINLLWLGLCLVFLFSGIEMLQDMIVRNRTAASMPWLPVWIVYASVPISQGIVGLRLVISMIGDVKHIVNKDHPDLVISAGIGGDQ